MRNQPLEDLAARVFYRRLLAHLRATGRNVAMVMDCTTVRELYADIRSLLPRVLDERIVGSNKTIAGELSGLDGRASIKEPK